MRCYLCHTDAGKQEFCPECGADLSILVRADHISNAYYNDGLMKAEVRNLSGAIISLRKSLKFNKYNIEARNLLGLVYFEIGETVDALSEWVISKSYQTGNNRATHYLEQVQQDPTELSTINQTIKKYNQALWYCRQDSRDLAKIQLKKVLTLNPKLVKGHQLLALLYIQEEKYEIAKKTLRNAGRIDTDNTTTLRYLREVNLRLRERNSNNPKKTKQEPDDLISYQSGNETIIMPKRFRESSIGATILYILLGLVVGLAVAHFLLVPNARQELQKELQQQIMSANNAVANDQEMIRTLENEIEELQQKLTEASEDNGSYQKQAEIYSKMVRIYAALQGKDLETAKDLIGGIAQGDLRGDYVGYYDDLRVRVETEYLESKYQSGMDAFQKGRFEQAIADLLTVYETDSDYEKGKATYTLAQAYRRNRQADEAAPYYRYVIDHFPESDLAEASRQYVTE